MCYHSHLCGFFLSHFFIKMCVLILTSCPVVNVSLCCVSPSQQWRSTEGPVRHVPLLRDGLLNKLGSQLKQQTQRTLVIIGQKHQHNWRGYVSHDEEGPRTIVTIMTLTVLMFNHLLKPQRNTLAAGGVFPLHKYVFSIFIMCFWFTSVHRYNNCGLC